MATIHIPFHQKYRPKNLDDLVGQEIISLTLKQALLTNRIAPAYLFCGPRGTGKTSSARILAKSLNCQKYNEPNPQPCDSCELCKSISEGIALDIIEIDAASNTGVENIREIIEKARFAPTQARWKVYVIDECHMLSTAASNALLKTIEEPPANVIFILATTNPERVIKTIQSRCQKFDFKRISTEKIYKHLVDIAKKEYITFEDIALKLIAKRSNGGMRDAQSLLDQLSLLPQGIDKNSVEELLGEVSENELLGLINSLIENNPELLLKSCSKLYDSGNEPISILEGLLNITRDLLIKTNNSEYSELFYTSKDFHHELERISKSISKTKVISWHKNLKNIEYQIKLSNQPRLWLEINLTSLINIQNISETTLNLDSSKTQKANYKESYSKENTKENKNLNPKNDEINPKNYENKSKENNTDKLKEENLKEFTKFDQDTNTSSNYDASINLKEKWSLILSKLELPSTRMLLSQQAELLNIGKNSVDIGLSPNWENMIKSRKLIIENAVKKIFGEHMKIQFSSKQNISSNIKKNIQINNEIKINSKPNDNLKKEPLAPRDQKLNNNTKNLADFFNGEIVDIND